MTLPCLLPLIAAVLYTFAAICTKRAIDGGAGVMRMFFITNAAAAAMLLAALPFAPPMPPVRLFAYPALCGALYFLAQLSLLLSIRLGEVTMQVPLLGVKVVFVAFFITLLTGRPLEPNLVLASAITAAGVFLMGFSSSEFSRKTLLTIVFAMAANASFAISDCVIQMRMGEVGTLWFMAGVYWTTFLISLALVPFFRAPLSAIPRGARKWTAAGAVIMCAQAFTLVAAMGIFKMAALANIIYATRGLWSIAVVWFAGRMLGNNEREAGPKLMSIRLAGASMMTAAVVIALW